MSTFHSIVVHKETVRKILKDFDISKSGVEDGITNSMLKMAANSSDRPLFSKNLFLSKYFQNVGS
jgi:FixJ family two-component response regulator